VKLPFVDLAPFKKFGKTAGCRNRKAKLLWGSCEIKGVARWKKDVLNTTSYQNDHITPAAGFQVAPQENQKEVMNITYLEKHVSAILTRKWVGL